METASIGFILWSLFLLLVIGVGFYSALRSRSIDEATEDIAEKTLPEIGRIAEKHHRKVTGEEPSETDWYPRKKAGGTRA